MTRRPSVTVAAGIGGRRFARPMPSKAVLNWALLASLWYVLSGKLDLLHLGTGAALALVIAAHTRSADDGTRFHPLRFLAFVPWLGAQVVLSNVRVARSVLSTRLPVAPALVRIRPQVAGERALALLAAGTTLTPGTLTVDVEDGELLVHALDRHSADELSRGGMARRVGRVFREVR